MLNRISSISPFFRPNSAPKALSYSAPPVRFGAEYHLPHVDLFCPQDKLAASPFSLGKPVQTAALETLREFTTPSSQWTVSLPAEHGEPKRIVSVMPNSKQAHQRLGITSVPAGKGYIVHVQEHLDHETRTHSVITDDQLQVTSFHFQTNAPHNHPPIIKPTDLVQRKTKTAQVFQSVIQMLSQS